MMNCDHLLLNIGSSASEKSWVVEMANVATIYVTPPPSSCDMERLFSTASEMLNRRSLGEIEICPAIQKSYSL